MIIKLSPARMEGVMTLSKLGDALTIDGETFDFTALPDGAQLPAEAVGCSRVVQPVERVGGQLIITLQLPITVDASEAACFPADIANPPDGEVSLPR
ncbi:hypothetical protein [Pseudomonas botevensis]|uniref:hypothetical protein n=1 Tax=Pseudomonas botevensis TaxID=2842352 RepID=UPI001C3C9899|nr:hypothetical protein [Pseudomonas botevensis]MBV4477847.1 hypothetical protein [Pseudomonas botevensis]